MQFERLTVTIQPAHEGDPYYQTLWVAFQMDGREIRVREVIDADIMESAFDKIFDRMREHIHSAFETGRPDV